MGGRAIDGPDFSGRRDAVASRTPNRGGAGPLFGARSGANMPVAVRGEPGRRTKIEVIGLIPFSSSTVRSALGAPS
jgi:hypothetical protein